MRINADGNVPIPPTGTMGMNAEAEIYDIESLIKKRASPIHLSWLH
jgi:hypothetical protein